jgi:hypothetical protein
MTAIEFTAIPDLKDMNLDKLLSETMSSFSYRLNLTLE